MNEPQLTTKQCYFLTSRGGRRKKDVIWVGNYPFVMMRDGKTKTDYPLLLPTDKDIFLEMRVKGRTPYVCEVGSRGYKLED